jgi:phosphocarrier protein
MTQPGSESQRHVRIGNKQGLHARPAAEFVKTASRYQSEIYVGKDDLEVNGKSIMGMMMLAAEFGSEIRIRATGIDCQLAVAELASLVERGFGEA